MLKFPFYKQNEKGFTLVELSIVIVIIGLIVAAVTAGQSLARQAKVKGVLTGVDQIKTAITAFKLEYGSLPGDLSNAQTFWAAAANGNGNGKIESGQESFGVFEQIALAGMYPGTYDGVNTSPPVTGQNVPASPVGGGTSFVIWRHSGGNAIYGRTAHSINLTIGSWYAAVTASEAYALDVKTDDGLASKGMIFSARGLDVVGADQCTMGTTAYNAASATYSLSTAGTNAGITCWMFFWIDK
jgi:prepilin-type N-terminal cleavage/methylation domain-containing protein